MTSSPVVNNVLQAPVQPFPPETLLNTKYQPANVHHQSISHNTVSGNLRKIILPHQLQNQQLLQQHQTQNQSSHHHILNQPTTNRVINSGNLIAVSAVGNVLNQAQLVGIQSQSGIQHKNIITTHDLSQNHHQQQLNVRVTMSALASQLSSPPALMSSATIHPQNLNFAQTTIINNNNSNSNNSNGIKQQQIILSSTNTRIISQSSTNRRESMTVPSPGSDSNASNTSLSNLGFSMPGLNTLLATSPPSMSGDGSNSNQGTSTLMERLNQVSSNSNGSIGVNSLPHLSNSSQSTNCSGPSPSQFMIPSPKSTSVQPHQQQQHLQHQHQQQHHQNLQTQSPSSISPLSSPPPQQKTTINLQGIDFSSLQGAMATFPGLQNVQVCIVFVKICVYRNHFLSQLLQDH